MTIDGPDADRSDVSSRVWAISDLQTPGVAEARRCLSTAIDDAAELDLDLDYVWYLGDAIMGFEMEINREIAEVQAELLEEFGVPVRFVMGNHDLDHAKRTREIESPFYETVRTVDGWRTTAAPEEFAFTERLGPWGVLFLSDHIAPDGRWCVTHGRIYGEETAYPYDAEEYRDELTALADESEYLIIAGHNAFPGGNRASELQRRFFPLPTAVRAHLYGHAHLGDEKHVGANAHRTLSYIQDHPTPQLDVASLEDVRGDTIRSLVLDLYADGSFRAWFRDHSQRVWLEAYQHSGIDPRPAE